MKIWQKNPKQTVVKLFDLYLFGHVLRKTGCHEQQSDYFFLV